MAGDNETIRVDAGGPYAWHVGEVAMKTVTSVCDTCDDIHLAISLFPEGEIDAGTPLEKSGRISLSPWSVSLDAGGGLPEEVEHKLAGVFDKYRDELTWRGERLLAARDRDRWKTCDLTGYSVNTLVNYRTLFPADFDLLWTWEDAAYFVEDYHCLVPECPCQVMGLVVTRIDDDTGRSDELGNVSIDLSSKKNPIIDGPKAARAVVEELLTSVDLRQRLMERRAEFRRIAPDAALLIGDVTSKQPVRNTKKVGRNEPCPCGSGKKFKKCCLK